TVDSSLNRELVLARSQLFVPGLSSRCNGAINEHKPVGHLRFSWSNCNALWQIFALTYLISLGAFLLVSFPVYIRDDLAFLRQPRHVLIKIRRDARSRRDRRVVRHSDRHGYLVSHLKLI